MFNRYWREYPWYFQLFQYLLILFVFGSLFGGIIAPLLVPQLTGVRGAIAITPASSAAEVNAVLWTQAIGHLGLFTLPVLLFAYLTHPQPLEYLGVRKPGRSSHWMLVALTTLGAIPVILGLNGLMRLFDFGEAANRLHAEQEVIMKKMMDIRSGGGLLWRLLVMAALPAVGEELMFRGVLMRFAARRARTAVFPIALSSVMFALAHFNNPYGLLPILVMGVLLALVYYWTRSLLCSMLMHFLFNASQIFLYYLSARSASLKAVTDSDSLPVVWLLIGAVLFFVSIWLLWRARTPMPQPAWTADFSAEELAAREEERQERMRL